MSVVAVVAVVAVVVLAVDVDTIHINVCKGVCKCIVFVIIVPSDSASVPWVAGGHVLLLFFVTTRAN